MPTSLLPPPFTFSRYFTNKLTDERSPFEDVHWEARTASISNGEGESLFEQKDVEVPAEWSQTATNIVASKYFHGKMDTPERERSVAQLVRRVVGTIAAWGLEGGYFATPADARNFEYELAHLMLTQKASFNSPVWFNVGVKDEQRGYGWYVDKAAGRVNREAGEVSADEEMGGQ